MEVPESCQGVLKDTGGGRCSNWHLDIRTDIKDWEQNPTDLTEGVWLLAGGGFVPTMVSCAHPLLKFGSNFSKILVFSYLATALSW